MTAARAIALRAKLIAAVTTALILLGAGGAAAYWTASAQLEGSATAAELGITQTDPLMLETVYDSGSLKAADTVTVHNTGTAAAELSVVVRAQGDTALPTALRVTVAETSDAQSCGTGAALAQPLTGGSGLTYAGTLGAGESIDLCIRTSIPARAVFRHAGEQARVSVTSTLTYADGAQWSRTSSGTTGRPLPQSVRKDPAAGVPQMTCRERDVLDASTWYSLRFSYAGAEGAQTREYRAYLFRDGKILDIPRSTTTFRVSGSSVTAQIPDDELVKIGGDLGVWQSVNARVVVETRTSGQNEWTTAATGKIRVEGFLIASNDAYCGWK